VPSELWIVVGALVGLATIWGLYKLRGGPVGPYVASGVAVVAGAIAAILAFGRRKPPPVAKPPPTVVEVEATLQPVLDVAHGHNDADRETEHNEVDKALEGPSPEEDLAALGNSRHSER